MAGGVYRALTGELLHSVPENGGRLPCIPLLLATMPNRHACVCVHNHNAPGRKAGRVDAYMHTPYTLIVYRKDLVPYIKLGYEKPQRCGKRACACHK